MNANNFAIAASVFVFGIAIFFAARSQSYERALYEEKYGKRIENHDGKGELDIPELPVEVEPTLTEKEKAEGVVMTASGLKYKIIRKGEGESPKPEDQVKVHYRGTLKANGKQFDSSYDRNEPATFYLNQVIKGWTEGLQLMKPGGKWQFTIPSKLGYGPGGMGADIPGNATLVFDVELLEVIK